MLLWTSVCKFLCEHMFFILLDIVLVRVLQKMWPTGYVQREKDIYFKELAHMIMEADKSKTCRVS